MTQPSRMAMIDPDNCTDEQHRVLAARGRPVANILRVFANNPPFVEALGDWSKYIFQTSTLPARDRELLILRCGWITGAEYQWAQHKRLASMAGLTDAEIERVKTGAEAKGWSVHEAALVRAVDELRGSNVMSDDTWKTLAASLSPPQLLDVIFVIGQTLMIASAINTLPMPLDEGLTGY